MNKETKLPEESLSKYLDRVLPELFNKNNKVIEGHEKVIDTSGKIRLEVDYERIKSDLLDALRTSTKETGCLCKDEFLQLHQRISELQLDNNRKFREIIQDEINKIPRPVGPSEGKASTQYRFYPSQPPTGIKDTLDIMPWQKKDVPLTQSKGKETSQGNIPSIQLKKTEE